MFRLYLVRPHPKKPGVHVSEWVNGQFSREDAEEEARFLLDDPRDTIVSIAFWDEKKRQFSGGVKK